MLSLEVTDLMQKASDMNNSIADIEDFALEKLSLRPSNQLKVVILSSRTLTRTMLKVFLKAQCWHPIEVVDINSACKIISNQMFNESSVNIVIVDCVNQAHPVNIITRLKELERKKFSLKIIYLSQLIKLNVKGFSITASTYKSNESSRLENESFDVSAFKEDNPVFLSTRDAYKVGFDYVFEDHITYENHEKLLRVLVRVTSAQIRARFNQCVPASANHFQIHQLLSTIEQKKFDMINVENSELNEISPDKLESNALPEFNLNNENRQNSKFLNNSIKTNDKSKILEHDVTALDPKVVLLFAKYKDSQDKLNNSKIIIEKLKNKIQTMIDYWKEAIANPCTEVSQSKEDTEISKESSDTISKIKNELIKTKFHNIILNNKIKELDGKIKKMRQDKILKNFITSIKPPENNETGNNSSDMSKDSNTSNMDRTKTKVLQDLSYYFLMERELMSMHDINMNYED